MSKLKLILINIIGGLGNQMFQYAAGLALAKRLDSNLSVDIGGFKNYRLHQGFELNRVFDCHAKIASNEDIFNILGFSKIRPIRRILRRREMRWLRRESFIVEPYLQFWSDFFSLKDNVYLDGYWQSERYFSNFEEEIRRAFKFSIPLKGDNLVISNEILNSNSISLHVRRGDYVTNTKNAFLGACSIDYYQAAIDYIAARTESPVFFIFSDDIAWVKQHLHLNYEKKFIDLNKGSDSHFDMQLMSLCKHNIIANSSFSWWGAWLNQNPNKITIAPRRWFTNGQTDQDLIPISWVRL